MGFFSSFISQSPFQVLELINLAFVLFVTTQQLDFPKRRFIFSPWSCELPPHNKSLPFAFFLLECWEPVRHSTHNKGHEEGGSAYSKAGSSLRSPPGYSRASSPQNQSLLTLLLCALTSDFTGCCPVPPSRSLYQRVNLQLQLIKVPGQLGVFKSKPLR